VSRARDRTRFADSYALLFVLLLATMVLLATAGDSQAGRVLLLVAIATSTWLALRASQVQRVLLRLAVAVIPVVTVVAVVITIAGSERASEIVTGVLLLLLVVVSPFAIVRRFASHPVITADTFFAAVSVYLLVAMFFAMLYRTMAVVTGDPFFVQTNDPGAVDYVYFSLVTITTVGYGDFTAAMSVGKMFAVIEAVLGQLYLITVVALVVQNLGQERKRRVTEEREAQD
jgi:hypothetical protein